MNCPHCGFALVDHEGDNVGFHHCNRCGCCFDNNLDQKVGHPVCTLTPKGAAQLPVQQDSLAQEALTTAQAALEELKSSNAALQEQVKQLQTLVVAKP